MPVSQKPTNNSISPLLPHQLLANCDKDPLLAAKVSQDSSGWHQAQRRGLSLPAWWLWAAHGHTYSSACRTPVPVAPLLLGQFLWPASQSQVWVVLLAARGCSRKDRAIPSTAERRSSSFWLNTELGKPQIHTHLHTSLFSVPFKTDSRKKKLQHSLRMLPRPRRIPLGTASKICASCPSQA